MENPNHLQSVNDGLLAKLRPLEQNARKALDAWRTGSSSELGEAMAAIEAQIDPPPPPRRNQ